MVEFGQSVMVHFSCTLDDGTVLEDTFAHGSPSVYKLGSKTMIPGFEWALSDMEVGERRAIRVPAALAYGAYDASLVEAVPVKDIPNGGQLPVGEYIEIASPSGSLRVRVLKIEGGKAFFDCNHEYAGKDINFDIELVSLAGGSESAIEREKHAVGCGCGCDRLKKALTH
jgi:FKBP-type peptidyl-prolyl cis-trans isomerase 2